MFRTIRVLGSLATPPSTPTDYYFDPKVMTLGTPKFDSNAVQGRVSAEEFIALRDKMIQAGGDELSKAKKAFYVMMFTMTALVIAFITKLVLVFGMGDYMTQNEYVIYFVIFFIPNILVVCFWQSVAGDAAKKIQAMLNQENAQIYASRGIKWIISHHSKYVQVKITAGAKYAPPQIAQQQL